MTSLQLTHVALVGARIPAFHGHGIHSREELALRRIAPDLDGERLQDREPDQRRALLKRQLPIWVHNILSDLDFPARAQMLMPLRRFEGELHDNRENAVVSAVLSAGFRGEPLDPLDLPASMPIRQRSGLSVHIGAWQEAWGRLEYDLVELLTGHAVEIDRWLDSARQSDLARFD